MLLQPPTDPGRIVAEVEALVPASSPYFLLSPWQAPDFAPHGLTLLGYPPLMVRLPAPVEVPAAETPDGAAEQAEATEEITAEDAGKSEA